MRDIYSKRNKKAPDQLVYDRIDEKLRVQIIRTWKKFFNQYDEETSEKLWGQINTVICDEHGKHTLLKDDWFRNKEYYRCQNYFENLESLEKSFDVIEIVFRAISKIPEFVNQRITYSPEEIVKELNERFRENDFGFEFTKGRMVRVDNKLLHKDILNQVIQLTNERLFINANEEFLSALDHLRHRRNKEALNDSLKSFESTMKIIIHEMGWGYDERDTASKLIQKCLENELIPKSLQSQFSALRTTLEAGIPTIRNKNSGHGQGPKKIVVPDSLATYSIYMTGTCINYLIELYRERSSTANR
ncbi:STM4504/CBY_0614 family protein [Belliella kenyensis]|uniref:STM4504/CBY_0614 family protein n=1 Tax=Belliella kenyensis TaxID=1472724 RepID=A0ABV8ENU5_9BACT|nr:hypothetical protein [Belliella kenyensis]MCH7403849.1 hypothetical protein [Belliella kenyensis]MDN3603018.1 hypothetical protein [Belliella kenyensis]